MSEDGPQTYLHNKLRCFWQLSLVLLLLLCSYCCTVQGLRSDPIAEHWTMRLRGQLPQRQKPRPGCTYNIAELGDSCIVDDVEGREGEKTGEKKKKNSLCGVLDLDPWHTVMVTLPFPATTPRLSGDAAAVAAAVVAAVVAAMAADVFASAVFSTMVPLRMGGLMAGVGAGVGVGEGAGESERVMVNPMAGLVTGGEVTLSALSSASRRESGIKKHKSNIIIRTASVKMTIKTRKSLPQ